MPPKQDRRGQLRFPGLTHLTSFLQFKVRLEVRRERSYFGHMNRKSLACLILAVGLIPGSSLLAQNNNNTAAAAAERDAAEENYRRLNAAIENLVASQEAQQKRIATLTDELRKARDENTRHLGKYATVEDLNHLAEKLKEVDKKRQEDKELILAEITKIGKTLEAGISKPPVGGNTSPKPGGAPRTPPDETPRSTEKGYEYAVQKDDTLLPIIASYNEVFKKEGKKPVTLKQVMDANPGLNPSKMKVGQKIFIPLPPEK
jgi:hypothetical protein